MSVLARFRALPDNDKSALIRKLVENSTPDFDYFFLISLSVIMATIGLLLDSGSVVIGSMLIAPLMYPILSVSLGLVMIGNKVSLLKRSISTLTKSLVLGLSFSTITAFLFGTDLMYHSGEVLARTSPSHLHLLVAMAAGAAVAYVLARPEWGDTLPGVAIAVALIPPLATVGVGIAALDADIIRGATMILLLNLIGIVSVAVVVFLLMNLGDKDNVAESTMKKENEKIENENKVIAEVEQQIIKEENSTTVIKENIIYDKNN